MPVVFADIIQYKSLFLFVIVTPVHSCCLLEDVIIHLQLFVAVLKDKLDFDEWVVIAINSKAGMSR